MSLPWCRMPCRVLVGTLTFITNTFNFLRSVYTINVVNIISFLWKISCLFHINRIRYCFYNRWFDGSSTLTLNSTHPLDERELVLGLVTWIEGVDWILGGLPLFYGAGVLSFWLCCILESTEVLCESILVLFFFALESLNHWLEIFLYLERE